MSLIPSESYSFPDHFTSTVAASRKPKNVEKIALPTLKPKVRWNSRAPAMNPMPPVESDGDGNGAEQIVSEVPPMPARNVIQPRRPPPLPKVLPRPENFVPANPRPEVQPRPQNPPKNPWPQTPVPIPTARPVARRVPPVPNPTRLVPPPAVRQAQGHAPLATPQTDFFEMFAETDDTVVWQRRRAAKMRRFTVCESIAIGILLPLAVIGLLFHTENPALRWILNVLTISAAVVSALIPIIFFAVAPTLPEIER